jgi:Flp pilus assembly protein TadD
VRLRALTTLGAVLFLTILGLNTMGRNAIWGDPVLLATEAKDLAPEHWIPRILLADALRHQGRCQEAAVEYRAAIAIRPAEEFPYSKLAFCLVLDRRRDEARAVLTQLRGMNPVSNEASSGLGVLAVLDGNLPEARVFFDEVVAREPANAQARNMLAFIAGTLPSAEQERMCRELHALADGPVPVTPCAADAQY